MEEKDFLIVTFKRKTRFGPIGLRAASSVQQPFTTAEYIWETKESQFAIRLGEAERLLQHSLHTHTQRD